MALSTGILLAGGSLLAHHSISAEFDQTKKIEFTGVVKKVEWLNPHIYTQVEVKDTGGKVLVYRVEGGAPNALYRNGVRPDSLKAGTVVKFTGIRAKNPESMNVNGRMTLENGGPAMPATATDSR
jgi:hypothetical protein